MAIAFGTQGTTPSAAVASITGTTSVTPALPASLATGDLCLIGVWNKTDSQTPTTPTDWGLVATIAGGGGSPGTDAGPVRLTVFSRVKDVSWSTMPTISLPSGNSAMTQAFRYTNATGAWRIAASGGADTASGTAWSVTAASDPGISAGDMVLAFAGCSSDTPTWASQSITATGITFGTMNERSEPRTTQGNDQSGCLWDRPASSGTSSAAPVATATLSASTGSTGVTLIVVLSEANVKSGSDGGSIAAAEDTPVLDKVTPLIAIKASTISGTDDAFVSTQTVAVPTGAAADDVAIIILKLDSGSTPTVVWPSGFSLITSATVGTMKLYAARKILTGADTGNYSISWGTQIWAQSVCVLLSGADIASEPITDFGINTVGSGTAIPPAAVDVAGASMLIHGLTNFDAGLVTTPPTGFTEIEDRNYIHVSYRPEAGGSPNASGGVFATSTQMAVIHLVVKSLIESEDEEPIGGSDAVSIAASETIAITTFNSVTDTVSISVSETSSIAKSSAVTDTGSLVVVDVSAIAISSGTTDSMSLAVSESVSLEQLETKSASDSISLATTETNALGVTVSVIDTSSLSVSETSAIQKSFPGAESIGLAVSESASLVKYIDVTDTAFLAVSDSSEIAKTIDGTESIGLAVTESSTVFKQIAVTDSMSLAVSETGNKQSDFPGTDSASLAVTESAEIVISGTITKTTSDSAQLAALDVSVHQLSLNRTDSSGLSESDFSQSALSSVLIDQTSIAVSDSAVLQKEIPGAESIGLTMSDEAEVIKFVVILVSDDISLSVDDDGTLNTLETIIKAYHSGDWHTGILKVYVDGEWVNPTVKRRTGSSWS